ncbi:MAG TPA: TonB-dependent receptor [Chitinophagaceae bacterium]|nr:TonB-dependent receptor [Chitinophagaceae bacterium]
MRNLLLLLLCVFTGAITCAQQITGIIKDEQGKVLQGATVALKKAKDSAVVKLAVSNSTGSYTFVNIAKGSYFVNTSHVGYGITNSPAFEVSGEGVITGPQISLAKISGTLKDVAIISTKPMVEVKADKTILNVEGSINAVGQDALELLRKSPGVMVDKDDNLSLSGKNGVQVYIDGRPTPLSGADLAAYLKTLQSSSIEAIEIITNPSAKYEAAGNAGIINIRLKKNKSLGTNGSVNLGYSIGTYPKYNAGFSLNHRNKNINVFGNYNYNKSRNERNFSSVRKLLDTLFEQTSLFTIKDNSQNFKAGLDYFINKKSTIGVMVNGNISENEFANDSRTPISYLPSGQLVKTLTAANSTAAERNSGNINLNYKYSVTGGTDFNIDADRGLYRIKSNQLQPNNYYDKAGVLYNTRIYNFIAPSDIDIYSFKTDYEQNFKKGRLGIGGKTSFVKTSNIFNRYDIISGAKFYDSIRSNTFNYKENINALYVNYNKAFKGLMVQFGVRMENTNLEGVSDGFKWNGSKFTANKDGFKRDYSDFFPSGAVTFNKKPMSQWGLRYSRRIDRPAYQDLNPFEFKLDEYVFQKGNINLRPQYTNSFALTHTYKYTLNTTLNYSHVKDVFTQLIDTAELSKSFITKKNLATQDVISLNVSYPFSRKWYSVFSNLNAYYSHYKANFGTGRTVDLDAFAFNIYQQHSFKLGKGYTGEISGFYSSPSIWQGTFKSKAIGGVEAGLLKTILKGNGTVKLAVSDIFNTMHFTGTSNFAGQYLRVSGGWESRLFKVNFSYRFGNKQVKAERQRKTSQEEENQRTKSEDGGGVAK